jgi:hypothetical protein
MRKFDFIAVVLGIGLAVGISRLGHSATPAPPAPPATSAPKLERPCEADPKYHELDFWVGRWDAIADGKKEGTNILEKTLGGCVLVENWTEAADGHEVKSFFVYNPRSGERKQIWVSDLGPMKERVQVEAPEKGSVRFLGEVLTKDGKKILDRSTLKPLSADRVHQRIELSRDGGKTWEVNWDADYVRQKGSGS